MPGLLLQAGTTFAGYVIQRELGHGGMAVVYLAEDVEHRRPVALKILDPGHSASIASFWRGSGRGEGGESPPAPVRSYRSA